MMNSNFNNGAANNNNNELNGGKMIMVNGRVENLVAFGEVVKGAIEELCTDCMVSVNEVTKNNGLTLTGITIKSTCLGHTVSWKPVSTDRFDSKKFKEEEPELYAKYTKTTVSRRFSLR